eukprot:7493611-Alexandrium_andersonii.AAC.1
MGGHQLSASSNSARESSRGGPTARGPGDLERSRWACAARLMEATRASSWAGSTCCPSGLTVERPRAAVARASATR